MAQDPAFSQFFASPLTLNPALTGKLNGLVRAAGNYRNQWPTVNNAFITSTISVDGNIFKDRLPETDAWGIGIVAMDDKTASGILTSNYVSISTAYHKGLDADGLHQISVGFQGTYASSFLDGKRLNFQDGLQIDGTWLPSPTEAVNSEELTIHYFDVNAGVLYNGSLNGDNDVYLGASLYHINRPKESFLGDDNIILPMRFTAHGGGFFPSSDGVSTLYVSGLYSRQASASEYVFGGAVELNVNNNQDPPTNFYIGSWVRFSNVTDAIIPYIGLDFGNFSLGLTYDINVSAFRTASESLGGVEISLIYIGKNPDGKKALHCPRF